MSLRGQNNYERAQEYYDVYLFWPSLRSRDLSHGDTPSLLYGPISLDSESTDYDSVGSGPPSPVMFAPVSDHRFPLGMEMAVDFGSAPPEELDATQVRNYNPSVQYSPIVKMGLLFAQMTRRVNRVREGIKLKLRKPKASRP